jgi:hypothetical protein
MVFDRLNFLKNQLFLIATQSLRGRGIGGGGKIKFLLPYKKNARHGDRTLLLKQKPLYRKAKETKIAK